MRKLPVVNDRAPDELPCAECGGQCCHYAAFTVEEWRAVRRKYGLPAGAKVMAVRLLPGKVDALPYGGPGMVVLAAGRDDDGTCAYLGAAGRCSVYDDRPETCRTYGVRADKPCLYLHPTGEEASDARR